MTRDDWPFVTNSWLKSYRDSKFARRMRSSIYFEEHGSLVREALARDAALVACAANVPDEIVGWVCYRPSPAETPLTIHYIYVPRRYRRQGFANDLLKATGWEKGRPIKATHVNHVYEEWRGVKERYRIDNNPYEFHRPEGQAPAQASPRAGAQASASPRGEAGARGPEAQVGGRAGGIVDAEASHRRPHIERVSPPGS